jgi:hypothetical protein
MARITITIDIDERLIENSNPKVNFPNPIISNPIANGNQSATDRDADAPLAGALPQAESIPTFFGQLPVGLQLETTPSGDRFTAEVTSEGIVVYGKSGDRHPARTPSEAASIVHRLRGGSSNTSINGWWYWRAFVDGQWVPLDELRRR